MNFQLVPFAIAKKARVGFRCNERFHLPMLPNIQVEQNAERRHGACLGKARASASTKLRLHSFVGWLRY
jgi:hypothetical protein